MLSSSCIYLYKVGRPTLKPSDGLPCMTQVLMYVYRCSGPIPHRLHPPRHPQLWLLSLFAHTGYLGDQSAVLFLGFNRYPRNGGIRDGNHFAILVGYDRGDENSVLPDVHSEGLCNVAAAQVDDVALFAVRSLTRCPVLESFFHRFSLGLLLFSGQFFLTALFRFLFLCSFCFCCLFLGCHVIFD